MKQSEIERRKSTIAAAIDMRPGKGKADNPEGCCGDKKWSESASRERSAAQAQHSKMSCRRNLRGSVGELKEKTAAVRNVLPRIQLGVMKRNEDWKGSSRSVDPKT